MATSAIPAGRSFGGLQWTIAGAVTLIWTVAGMCFASMFVADYPQYAPLGYGTAAVCALGLGLIHLGWLALFPSRSAALGMVIAKLCAIPVTIGGGFFALGLGVMGSDSGVENAAQALPTLLPICMAIAAAPTTLAALLGAGIGHGVGRRKAAAAAGGGTA